MASFQEFQKEIENSNSNELANLLSQINEKDSPQKYEIVKNELRKRRKSIFSHKLLAVLAYILSVVGVTFIIWGFVAFNGADSLAHFMNSKPPFGEEGVKAKAEAIWVAKFQSSIMVVFGFVLFIIGKVIKNHQQNLNIKKEDEFSKEERKIRNA